MIDLNKLGDFVIAGDPDKVDELTRQAIDEGLEPEEIIKQGLIKGMDFVGAQFKAGEMYVPEVMMSARAMSAGMELIKPLYTGGDIPSAGKTLIGTVAGDLHDIGKNLVGMMMESAGMIVIDLGIDVSTEEFVRAAREHKPDVLAMSALLTTTMVEMKNVIELLKEQGIRDSVKVIVGGAPVSDDYAQEIGADGWAPDAASAKDLALGLVDK